eukprot:jgi/Picre1/28689/NNA_004089.t1
MPQRNSRDDWGGPSRYNHNSRERDVRRARLREEELEAELDDYMLEESSSPRLREPHSRREERYFGNSPRKKEFRYSEERKRERSGRYGGRSESSEWREYGSPQRRTDKARSKTDAALEIAARLNKKYERKPSRSISPRRRSSHHRWQDSRSPSPRRKRRYRSSSRSSSRSPSRRYSYDRRKSGRKDRDWDRSHENRGRRFSHSDDNRSKQYGRHRRSGEYHADKPDDAFMSVPPPPPPPPPVVPPPPLENIQGLQISLTGWSILQLLRMSKPKSWEEQEEQCRLLVLRYGLRGAEDDDKEPFSSDEFKEYFSRPGRTGEEIPYEQRSPIEDPRRQFTKEYEFMTAWAGKPRPLPGFVNDTVFKQQNGDQSPTLSWSTSPARAGSPAKQKTQRPEPKPQTKISMSNRPSTGGKNASVPRDLNMMDGKHSTMELEEGYFCVKLLNGQDVMLQYDEIVDLIKKGSYQMTGQRFVNRIPYGLLSQQRVTKQLTCNDMTMQLRKTNPHHLANPSGYQPRKPPLIFAKSSHGSKTRPNKPIEPSHPVGVPRCNCSILGAPSWIVDA